MRRALAGFLGLFFLFSARASEITLPSPKTSDGLGINQIISARRSVRSYSPRALSLSELSQLLWSAQGITEQKTKKRSAPSAGAIYPLGLYVSVKKGGIEGLEEGIYLYLPETNTLKRLISGDFQNQLAQIAFGQIWMARAPVIFIFTAESAQMWARYRERAWLYIHLEAGMASENLMLQAVALGMGSCAVGAFWENRLSKLLKLSPSQKPLLMVPVGKK